MRAGKSWKNPINYIYRDNEQRLWITTDAGINIMDPHLQIFSDHPLLEQKTFQQQHNQCRPPFRIFTNKPATSFPAGMMAYIILTTIGKFSNW